MDGWKNQVQTACQQKEEYLTENVRASFVFKFPLFGNRENGTVPTVPTVPKAESVTPERFSVDTNGTPAKNPGVPTVPFSSIWDSRDSEKIGHCPDTVLVKSFASSGVHPLGTVGTPGTPPKTRFGDFINKWNF